MRRRTTRAPRARLSLLVWSLVIWLAATLPAPPAAAGGTDDTGPDQAIDASQSTERGPVTLSLGHVDIGPRMVSGTWTLMIHDDTAEPSVWRPFDDVVVAVPDTAQQAVPDDERYAFLGIDAGAPVHIIPQTQDPDVVWLGWNTQAPDVLDRLDRGATISLVGVDGPGDLTVYLQAGTMEPPDVLWQSAADDPGAIFVDTNTHTHANWLFSAPGVYLVRLRVDAELVDGTSVSDVQDLRVAVGDGTEVDDARRATYTGPAGAPPTTASPAAPPGTGTGTRDAGRGVAIAAAVAATLLLALATRSSVRSRTARRRAEGADRLAVVVPPATDGPSHGPGQPHDTRDHER